MQGRSAGFHLLTQVYVRKMSLWPTKLKKHQEIFLAVEDLVLFAWMVLQVDQAS